jgi:hypothetical protein
VLGITHIYPKKNPKNIRLFKPCIKSCSSTASAGQVINEFTTSKVLALTFVKGTKISDLKMLGWKRWVFG